MLTPLSPSLVNLVSMYITTFKALQDLVDEYIIQTSLASLVSVSLPWRNCGSASTRYVHVDDMARSLRHTNIRSSQDLKVRIGNYITDNNLATCSRREVRLVTLPAELKSASF